MSEGTQNTTAVPLPLPDPGEAPLLENQNRSDISKQDQEEQKYDVALDIGRESQDNSAITNGREQNGTDQQPFLSEESLNEIAKQLYYIQNYAFEAEENIADVEHTSGPGSKRRKVEENNFNVQNNQSSTFPAFDMDYYLSRSEKDLAPSSDHVTDKRSQTQKSSNVKNIPDPYFAAPIQNSGSNNKSSNVRFRIRPKPGDPERVQAAEKIHEKAVPEQRIRSASEPPIFDGGDWPKDSRSLGVHDYYDFRGEKPLLDPGLPPQNGSSRSVDRPPPSTNPQMNPNHQRRERSQTVPRVTNQPQPAPTRQTSSSRMGPAEYYHQNWPQDHGERISRVAPTHAHTSRQVPSRAQQLACAITNHVQWLSKSVAKSLDDQNLEALHYIESSLREVMPSIYWTAFDQQVAAPAPSQPQQQVLLHRGGEHNIQSYQTRQFIEPQPNNHTGRPRSDQQQHSQGHAAFVFPPNAMPIHSNAHVNPLPRKAHIPIIVVDPSEEVHPGAPLRVDSRVASPVQEHQYFQRPVAPSSQQYLLPTAPAANVPLLPGIQSLWHINSDKFNGPQLAPIFIPEDEGHNPFGFARYGSHNYNCGPPNPQQRYSYPSSSQSGQL